MATSSAVVAESWKEKAAKKKASILEQNPDRWRLSKADLKRARRQQDLIGPFIRSFLTPETIRIISLDTADIVAALQNGELTAVQVVTAFCHCAAVAHQIVRLPLSSTHSLSVSVIFPVC
jgi:amidase